MKRVLYWIPVFVAMLSLTIPVNNSFGQDDPKSTESESTPDVQEQEETKSLPGEVEFNELNAQHEALSMAFAERSQEARGKFNDATDEERQVIIEAMQGAQKEMMSKANEIALKMVELAKAETTDKAIAFQAVMWVLENSQGAAERKAAVDVMVSNHLDNPELVDVIPQLTNGLPSQATEDLLKKLAENGATEVVKGVATISLVSYYREYRDMVAGLIDNEAFAKQYPDSIDYFKQLAKVEDEQIEGLLSKATEAFADVEYQGSTIGEMAAKELKKILIAKNLQIGKVAPDIEGPDLDGTTFKLSDYRGKVVMIDFWGDW